MKRKRLLLETLGAHIVRFLRGGNLCLFNHVTMELSLTFSK